MTGQERRDAILDLLDAMRAASVTAMLHLNSARRWYADGNGMRFRQHARFYAQARTREASALEDLNRHMLLVETSA